MSIALRHPQSHQHSWHWLAAGATVVVLAAGAFAGTRAITSSDTTGERPAVTTADPSGLGAVLSTEYPTAAAMTDPSGLGVLFGTRLPSEATAVDATGLGAVFGVQFPAPAIHGDATGLGRVLSVQFPTG